jgi:O-antigen ligase
MDRGSLLRLLPLYLLAVVVPVSVAAANVAAGLVIVGAVAVLVIERGRAVQPPRTVTLVLLALIAWYALATLFGTPERRIWHKLVEESWIKLLLPAVGILAGRAAQRLEHVLKTALVMGGIVAAYAVVQHFTGYDPVRGVSVFREQFGHNSVRGFFSHHLSYAGQALVYLVMAAAWALDGPTLLRTPALAAMTATIGMAMVWTFSRSALLGAVAGLPLLILAQPRRIMRGAAAAGAAAFVLAMSVGQVREHALSIFDLSRHETRLNLWRSTLAALREHPLFGVGPGNFKLVMESYRVPGLYESEGHAHHDLLMHGANAGIPAILLALGLLAATCWLFARAARRSARLRWVMVGAIGVQAAITVAGLFQVYQTDDEVELLLYLVLGIAAALAGAVLRGEEDQSSL